MLDLLYNADLNRDTYVDYEEFKKMLCDPNKKLNKHQASFMVKLLREAINLVSSEKEKKMFKIISK